MEFCRYKKIITPIKEVDYRLDGIDNKYLINEGKRSLGVFAATKGVVVPTQIAAGEICFYILEGSLEILNDDKTFLLKAGDMLLIPHSCTYSLNFVENAKAIAIRM